MPEVVRFSGGGYRGVFRPLGEKISSSACEHVICKYAHELGLVYKQMLISSVLINTRQHIFIGTLSSHKKRGIMASDGR